MVQESNAPHDQPTWTTPTPHRRSRSDNYEQQMPIPEISEDNEPPVVGVSQRHSPSSTPPKKTWERHFRSFLSKHGSNESPDVVSAIEPTGTQLVASRQLGAYRSKFSLVPGSRRLLTRNVSDGSITPGSFPPIPSTAGLPKTKSSEEMTIKGGSFFSHVFHKDSSKSAGHSISRKTKSMDTLDTTVRKGFEKSYSPRTSRNTIDHSHERTPELPTLTRGSAGRLSTIKPLSPRLRSHLSSSEALGNEHNAPALRRLAEACEPVDEPSSLNSSGKAAATTEIKKAFTEFHNSSAFAKDSTSAYLGDDSSVSGHNFFAMYKALPSQSIDSESGCIRASMASRPISKSLDPVSEELLVHKSQRMLKPVVGPETWSTGRRYLIAPAVLATCTLQVLPALSGSTRINTFEESMFGILELGKATISYVGKRNDATGWSACTLVLRQNYLLEYDRDRGTSGVPRGFAHLQFATAYPHEDFLNALELDFFGSPCAKSDKRKLLIRVDATADRDRWVSCLNDASKLSIDDLYDFDGSIKVGQGRYASVYPARRRGNDGRSVAIKVVDKTEFWSRVVKGMERADTLVREASIQATLSSKGDVIPSVLKLSGVFETSDNIVFELDLLEGTDLFRYVSSKGSLSEIEAACIVRDILVCLEAMYRFGVAHRDIKPANIIMCDQATDGVHIKVADFGMSAFVGLDGLLRGRCGTPGYVAPEIFSASANGGYGNKVDIFSAGVTLYVMLCGYEPFFGETDSELIEANKQAIIEFPDSDWSTVSVEARDLVNAMVEPDPNKRISAKDALHHPWITSRTGGLKSFVELRSKDPAVGAACVIS